MAQTFMPTDLADFMPTSRSSNTVQSTGAAPRRLAARQVTSGWSCRRRSRHRRRRYR